MDTFEKIRALLAEQLDVDPAKITMDSDIMSDFEADSLDIVDMVMTLEDEFGIEVPDGRCGKLCGQPRAELIQSKSPAFWCGTRPHCMDGAFNMVRAERKPFGARP